MLVFRASMSLQAAPATSPERSALAKMEKTMLVTRRGIFSAGIGAVVSPHALAAFEADGKPGHVVLLGDSIFDNKRYVDKGPAVIDQLREALPEGWKATLLAIDGSIAADV